MPTKDELEVRNAQLEAQLKEARKGGDTASLKARIATLEGAAGVDATPPRPSRPDEVRVKNYGGALLKTVLEQNPDPKNYPEGGRAPSPLELENIELKRQLAEQGAVARDPVVVLDDTEFNESEVEVPGPPTPPSGQAQYG